MQLSLPVEQILLVVSETIRSVRIVHHSSHSYYKLHSSAFEYPSPVTLYHSVKAENAYEQHCQWMDIIRRTVWLRADKESSNMPSTTALKLHWLRCLWVLNMWRSATENELELPGIYTYKTFLHTIINLYNHIHNYDTKPTSPNNYVFIQD